MKKLLPFLFLALSSFCYADSTTNRLGLTLPTIGSPTWGQKINGNFQIIDATVAALGARNVINSSTTYNAYVQFNSTVNFHNLKSGSGQCIGIDASSNTIIIPCGSGGGSLATLSDVHLTSPISNDLLTYNGTVWVNAPAGTSFSFSIASFGDSLPATVEQGVGIWKSTGNINFLASYSNGPPIGSTITFSGWASPLIMSFPFTSIASAANVNFPSVGGTVVFVLSSQKSTTASASITHFFNNDRYWGVDNISSGSYTSGDIRALASNDLTNSIPNVFTVNPGAGQYIVYAYPSRLGTAIFSVGGFVGGFNSPVTASVTNASGFTENYSVYSSVNSNLGSTTVTVTTP
jgi:hypothetical protein